MPTLRDDPAANISFWDTSADHNYSESREESVRLEGRDFHLESPVSEMYREGTGLLSLSKLLRTVTVKLIASLLLFLLYCIDRKFYGNIPLPAKAQGSMGLPIDRI